METRPIFLSRAIRCTPKVKIPTVREVHEVKPILDKFYHIRDKKDYCESVGLDYDSVNKYSTIVQSLEDNLRNTVFKN